MTEFDLIRVAYDFLAAAKSRKEVQIILVFQYEVGPFTAKMIVDRAFEILSF